jgi:hypothetical protein
MLEKIGQYLQGKKTYIVAVLIGLAAAATQLGYVIPEIVWPILGALGLGAVRSAIEKLKS